MVRGNLKNVVALQPKMPTWSPQHHACVNVFLAICLKLIVYSVIFSLESISLIEPWVQLIASGCS